MTSGRRRVVCLTTFFPWPAQDGGALRIDGLLRSLAADFDVEVLVPHKHDVATMAALIAEAQQEIGLRVQTYEAVPAPIGRRANAALWAGSVAAGVPPWVQSQIDRDLVARLPKLLSDADALVLLDDFAGIYPMLAAVPAATTVVADKHVVLARPRSADDAGANRRAPLGTRLIRRLTMRYERRYLARVDEVVVTSSEDAAWLERLYGRRPAAIVSSAVDLPEPRLRPAAPSKRVGWLSSLDASENVDGLTTFLTRGWPQVGRAGYELAVAGRGAPPSVQQLSGIAGVELVGFVPSVADFLAEVDAAVVPLWAGRGVKVKTLTMMAAGVPVVATPSAVEGIDVESGRHCLVGETSEELADHLLTLLADPGAAAAMGDAGRDLVAASYTWTSLGPRFAGVVGAAIERRHRR